eukprot:COSAG06_NODE_12158_length_1416_cov_1.246773_2_plen_97_part_01
MVLQLFSLLTDALLLGAVAPSRSDESVANNADPLLIWPVPQSINASGPELPLAQKFMFSTAVDVPILTQFMLHQFGIPDFPGSLQNSTPLVANGSSP